MNKPDIPVMVAQASGSEVSGGRDRRDTEVPPTLEWAPAIISSA